MSKLLSRVQRELRIFQPRAARLIEKQRIGQKIYRLRYQGNDLRHMWPINPGQQLSLLVEGGWPRGGRKYRIARCDEHAAWLELFVLAHSQSPGSVYARETHIGDQAQIWGPGGGIYASPHTGKTLYLSDETGVGSGLAMLEKNHNVTAVICVDDATTADALLQQHPRFVPVVRASHEKGQGPERDDALRRWLQSHERNDDLRIVLTGRIRSCYQLRSALIEDGVASPHIHVRGFWDDTRTRRKARSASK